MIDKTVFNTRVSKSILNGFPNLLKNTKIFKMKHILEDFFFLIQNFRILCLVYLFELKTKVEMIQSITSFISTLLAGRLRLCFPSQAKVWISLLFCMNFKRTEIILYCSKMISMTEVNLSKNKMPPCN